MLPFNIIVRIFLLCRDPLDIDVAFYSVRAGVRGAAVPVLVAVHLHPGAAQGAYAVGACCPADVTISCVFECMC